MSQPGMERIHWTLTYVMLGGARLRTSTREGGLQPTTEKELMDAQEAVIRERAQRPLPTLWVRDADRDGLPTQVLLGRLSHVELDPDPDPEYPDPEVRRHLELVLTDPEPAGPRGVDEDPDPAVLPPDPEYPDPEAECRDRGCRNGTHTYSGGCVRYGQPRDPELVETEDGVFRP